jgi:N-acetylgalactosamine kinase
MRSASLNKVCFPIGGVPAVLNTVRGLHECGIKHNFIVIGHLCEQVMEALALSESKNYFCYQPLPLGTGNAARTAAKLIEDFKGPDAVLVIAGDKVIHSKTLKALIKKFYDSGSDLCLVSGNADDFPQAGKLVMDDQGDIAGIAETADINRAGLMMELSGILALSPLPAEKAEKIVLGFLKTEKKAEAALGPLWLTIKKGKSLTLNLFEEHFPGSPGFLKIGEKYFQSERIKNQKFCNMSVYLFKKSVFLSSVKNLGSDNAQSEEYLTDAVAILSSGKGKITRLQVESPCSVMAYNTPEELKSIEEHLCLNSPGFEMEKPCHIRTPLDWLRHFETSSKASVKYFESVYGKNYPLTAKKREGIVKALIRFKNRFGNTPCVISRAPGRINLMGRHIDHQGGDVNMIAIDRDIYCIMGERNDSKVVAHNLDAHRFPEREFDLREMHVDAGLDWEKLLSTTRFEKQASIDKGDWVQYVKAVFSRFKHGFPSVNLKGVNMVFEGDIPAGGGVSSSSALFVAVAEGAVKLNNIKITPERFVGFCGEGEWYVGTRGGSADHGAIKFSKKGLITQLEFFPFKKIRSYPFPEGYTLAVCNSQQKAHKTRGVKDIFNQRVACYHAGLVLLRQNFPVLENARFLRDISYGGISSSEILKMIKSLPEKIEASRLLKKLDSSGVKKRIKSLSSNTGVLPLRSVVLFGICECARGKYAHELLQKSDARAFGRLMNISHDGDRKASRNKSGDYRALEIDYSDKRINLLIKKAQDEDYRLADEPGSYSCSTPEIDLMVDAALGVPGVCGAQISGAGLGGCMMALVRKEDYRALEEELVKSYYEPSHLDPDMFAALPVAGSGIVYF